MQITKKDLPFGVVADTYTKLTLIIQKSRLFWVFFPYFLQCLLPSLLVCIYGIEFFGSRGGILECVYQGWQGFLYWVLEQIHYKVNYRNSAKWENRSFPALGSKISKQTELVLSSKISKRTVLANFWTKSGKTSIFLFCRLPIFYLIVNLL